MTFPLPVLLLFWSVIGHGSLVSPLSRNAVDRPPYGPNRCICANSTADCDNGQACYWYSQGCFIGCPTCDSVSGRAQTDLCGLGKNATINDPLLRTVNRNATAGSIYDIYRHNPWRAPGSAPVMDACGLAGGTPWPQNVSEWGDYVPTKFAKHGDYGTKVLPKVRTGTVWKIGGEAETIWQIRANHGGGYQYRLCPASEELTEDCFQKHPLDFVTTAQRLQFINGTRLPIKGTFVDEGTLPKGSMWAMNPIPPRCLGGGCSKDKPFCQPCPLPVKGRDCTSCDDTPDPCFEPPCDEGDTPGLCSGNQGNHPGNAVAVVDTVKVPGDLPAGEYVLGWRMDCEATAQVWSNCADLTLVK